MSGKRDRRRMTDRRIRHGDRKPDRRKSDRREPEESGPDDVISDGRIVRVLRRPDESREEYEERLRAASPPLSEEQKDTIRNAAREYWAILRERRRKD
jgi:hypothetical protein